MKLLKFFLIIFVIILSFSRHLKAFANPAWIITSSLPSPLASHISTVFSNKIYVVGGAKDIVTPTNLVGILNVNGSLNSWNPFVASPAIFWHSSIKNNDYIYLLGGATYPPTTSINNVYVGRIINGGVSNWNQINPLPVALSLGSAFAYQDKLYFAGGFTEQLGNSYAQKIYISTLATNDGTIGNWTEVGNLPMALSGFGMFTEGNHITIVGGENSNGKTNKSYTTSINGDGTIGSWQETASLPKPLSRAQFTRSGSTIFAIGGINSNGTASDDVYYAKISNDGALDTWQTSNLKMPQPTCCGTAESINNFIYLIGGHNPITAEYFDKVYYVSVQDIIGESEQKNLNVPLFKQGLAPYTNSNPSWENDIFDHASGQFTCGTKMWQCGCTTTSMAMVLKYHGITKLPNGKQLDPGSLNKWLKDTPGGYFRDSGINWAVAATLGKKGKAYNPQFTYNTLEYLPVRSPDENALRQDLINGNPPVLDVTGHFIVGTGFNGNSFTINDPFYNRTSLDPYNNSFAGLRRFLPHNSDSSYIVMAIDKEVNLSLHDSTGQLLEEAYIQNPINDPLGNKPTPSPSLNILEYPKPESGEYQIRINGDKLKTYQLDIYEITKEGELKSDAVYGAINSNTNELLKLSFDKISIHKSYVKKNVTFDSMIKDIEEARALNLITKDHIANRLVRFLQSAQSDMQKGKTESAEEKIEDFEEILHEEKNETIKYQIYRILDADLKLLRKNF